MNLLAQLAAQLADSGLSLTQQVHLRCKLSKELEEAGDYEGSLEAMGEFWLGVGKHPNINGLEDLIAAEVLLRVGSLTNWIGNSKMVAGAQETAKDLISESIRLFQKAGHQEGVLTAKADLALCYWRQGALDEARLTLREVLDQLGDESELKAVSLLRLAIVEMCAGRLKDALRIHTGAMPLFEASGNPSLKGRFHVNFALVLRNLASAENSSKYLDRALIEYTAASFHFEQAGHIRYWARVENNLGFLFSTIGRFEEAHKHIDQARQLFSDLGDKGSVAQVDDTRARTLLAEGHSAEAEKVARAAVETLERSGEQSLLAASLTTHGAALARMALVAESRTAFQRAIEVAAQAGDPESAGVASLTTIEELHGHLRASELLVAYEQAGEFLHSSQVPDLPKRFFACACKVRSAVDAQLIASNIGGTGKNAPNRWKGFSLDTEIQRYESVLIESALKDADGLVTRASEFLGFKHHQSLIWRLNNRHKALMKDRSEVKPRRRSIITRNTKNTGRRRPASHAREKETQKITILHVEYDEPIAGLVKEMLQSEGWDNDHFVDAETALKKLASKAHYDLIIATYQLPGLNGVEFVYRARKIPHRRRTPIIMLSETDCETLAWRAGVDAFLKKEKDAMALPVTIARLLKVQLKSS